VFGGFLSARASPLELSDVVDDLAVFTSRVISHASGKRSLRSGGPVADASRNGISRRTSGSHAHGSIQQCLALAVMLSRIAARCLPDSLRT